MKFLKKIIFILLVFALLISAGSLLISRHVLKASQGRIFANHSDLKEADAVTILGAKVYEDGRLSSILIDRIKTALEVYRNGKAKKILVSGDHGRKSYDEVNAVKRYLLDVEKIPGEDIFLDHAGFDTYDSLYRAHDVFEAKKLIISTQSFHLPRAVYIGQKLGLDTQGIVADKQTYRTAVYNELRENLARCKAFTNVFFKVKPKFGGYPIPINGDGRKSWD